jgi:ATP-binding cassette subfamily C protein CydC
MASRFGRDVDLLEDAAIRRVDGGPWTAGLVALAMVSLLGWRAALAWAWAWPSCAWPRASWRATCPRCRRKAQAHAAIQADYADMAGPAADIAVYDLAPRMTTALETSAAAQVDAGWPWPRRSQSADHATAIASLAIALAAALARGLHQSSRSACSRHGGHGGLGRTRPT